jgi:peptidoglycan-N-acetylglucosamine deacetylase
MPTSSPLPTPSPAPGVLPYPLYGGNPHLPEIALTFDDGPNPPYTSQVLAILQQYHVQATFFHIGSQVATFPALVSQEVQQGMVVGDHTWTHPDLTALPPDQVQLELQRTAQEIGAFTGVTPTVFRPPGGNFNSQVRSIAASLGLSTVLWNVDPKDWSRPGTGVIIQRVLGSTQNGSIILMHDGGGDRSQTIAALPTIITTLEQRGYHFVTIPQMIKHLPAQGTAPSHISPDQFTPESALLPGQSFEGDVLSHPSLFAF